MHPKELAEYYKIAPQADGEDDRAFRIRVATRLREMGKIIEAHEVMTGARWDDPKGGDNVITGIMGAMALALAGTRWHGDPVYPNNGEQQLGDDVAAGTLARDDRPKQSPEEMLLLLQLLGG